ncbi:MAG: tRNA-(ms[2]io[6]A)-hydroxylase [Bacteroidetes bacterium]|nr:tRNA-(ms[2]io[6]A)-hydroxylase [Bacteroidota bacterium]MBK9049211.1 tRNA-(ms[2]io[6]A)-hydroxylase [Bacteroidota bacterium]MBK9423464.1 tRNA-(ms[2]io[6]A)-hydroxylase [Bacteroidota bacterium]
MFKLKLPTDPKWVRNVVGKNIPEILTDHAWCEQKAATNAISIVVKFPELTDLVQEMILLAKEELSHFEMVHNLIQKRGFELGRERKDDYVGLLYNYMRKGGPRNEVLIDRLLFAAMIEARSCERFKVLSENIDDTELAAFYNELMISEANHYTMFIGFARKYAGSIDVEKRWEEWLAYEAQVIQNFGVKETVHG